MAEEKKTVATTHPLYDTHIERWARCRDVLQGQDAVKARGPKYLPTLTKQRPDSYLAYKDRALFFNATERTRDGIRGLVFAKTPVTTYPESARSILEMISNDRQSMDTFAQRVFDEVIGLGRYGILVDLAKDGGVAYMAGYGAESIINWSEDLVNGRLVPTLVVLKEEGHRLAPDGFGWIPICQLRELRLFLVNGQLQYGQQIWEERETAAKKKEWTVVERVVPVLVRGRPIDFIPFVCGSAKDIGMTPDKPPLLDLVDLNLSHYRTMADLEHGRHFTALPTPWIAGFDPKSEFYMGSEVAWVSNNPQANAGFLEFTGQGLRALETASEEKREMMAVLGARLIEAQKRGVEAADTVRMHRLGEDSVVAAAATVASQMLTQSLRWVAYFNATLTELVGKAAENISYTLNKEFVNYEVSPQMLAALVSALQGNTISYDTFFHNLQRGGIIDEKITKEEEEERIERGGPQSDPADTGKPGMDLDDEQNPDNVDDLDPDKQQPRQNNNGQKRP